MQQSMVIRAKRRKSTFFILCNHTCTVRNLKSKIAALLEFSGFKVDHKDVRLSVPKNSVSTDVDFNQFSSQSNFISWTNDSATIEQLSLVDDCIIYFTLRDPNDANNWEQIVVFPPDTPTPTEKLKLNEEIIM